MKWGKKICGLLAIGALGVALSACNSVGYNHTSIPNVPFINLDIHKQEHPLSTTDRVCVFNGGDMITDTGTRYQNSGRFLHKIFFTTLQQYNIDGSVNMINYPAEGVKPFALQDSARNNYCNLIAITRPIFWQDSQISPGNVGFNVDMYDTSSLNLVNSVTLNARSNYIRDMFLENSPLKPVIETYVDHLYNSAKF